MEGTTQEFDGKKERKLMGYERLKVQLKGDA